MNLAALADIGQTIAITTTAVAGILHLADTRRHRPGRPPALTPEQRDHLRNWAA